MVGKTGYLESLQELEVLIDVMTNSILMYLQIFGFIRIGLKRKLDLQIEAKWKMLLNCKQLIRILYVLYYEYITSVSFES